MTDNIHANMKKLTAIITFLFVLIYGARSLYSSISGNDTKQTEQTVATDSQNEAQEETDFREQQNSESGTAEETSADDTGKDFHIPADSKGGIIVEHKAYTLSFNKKHNTPDWVAWRLTAKHTDGQIERSTKFWADPKLPKENRVDYYEYKESDYSRGHMCPAGDNKWSEEAMYECFYMSNMCPQDPELNGGPWGDLEKACRRWARSEGEIFIVCGPIYKGKKHETIGINHKISVPEGFYKAVMSLQPGKEKAIAFIFSNDSKNRSYRKAVVSVDEVEKKTGIDFFPKTKDSIEQRIEAKADINDWK